MEEKSVKAEPYAEFFDSLYPKYQLLFEGPEDVIDIYRQVLDEHKEFFASWADDAATRAILDQGADHSAHPYAMITILFNEATSEIGRMLLKHSHEPTGLPIGPIIGVNISVPIDTVVAPPAEGTITSLYELGSNKQRKYEEPAA